MDVRAAAPIPQDAPGAQQPADTGYIAALSHELREPMNGVLGMARLLLGTPLDHEQRSYLAALLDAGETLLSLVNDLIDLSRVDAGAIDLLEVDFALKPFLERLQAVFEPRARHNGLTFKVEIAPELPALVRTDPGRLRQILTNLLGNALKFTESGTITLRALPCGGREGRAGLRLEVEDTGPGIAAAALSTLFQRFAQGGPDTRRLYGGSGLGLMIAQGLAQALGGSIAVASADGRTTFAVELSPTPALGESGPEAPATASITGASLLLVDAQQRTREPLLALARRWGLIARGARSAAQATTMLHEAADRGAPFDIVVIDRSLPDMPGDELGRAIARDGRMGHARLVLLVGAGVRGDAARASAAGFAAYLPKPVDAGSLLDCLTRLRAGEAELITRHRLAEHRRRPLRVLVADDNALNRKLLEIMLQREGHSVQLATNGREAVAAVVAAPFDLVLMDVRMPELDGMAATRAIRGLEDATRAGLPVVAVTANAMEGDEQACLDAGMNAYMTKPINAASLNGAIGSALAASGTPAARSQAASLEP